MEEFSFEAMYFQDRPFRGLKDFRIGNTYVGLLKIRAAGRPIFGRVRRVVADEFSLWRTAAGARRAHRKLYVPDALTISKK